MVVYPSSNETEYAVIGALVTDPKTHDLIFSKLTVDDFFNPECRKAFIGARELFEGKKVIDIVTMMDYMDAEALSNSALKCYISSVPYYIRVLKEKNVRRQFVDAGRKIMELAAGNSMGDIVELKSEIVGAVDIKIENEKRYAEMPEVVDNVMKEIENRMKNEDGRLKYGIPWLDKKTKGLWGGDIVILAARPSVGKSAFALDVSLHNAFKGFKVGFFNLEMTKETMTERLLANMSGVSGDLMREPKELSDDQWRKMSQASCDLANLKMYMIDDTYSIEGIEMKARMLMADKGIDLLVIDYLQLMESRRKFNNSNEKVTHISRRCKLLAKDLKIPVILLSQLNRDAANKEPDLSNLRESGAIEQDADVVIFLHDPHGAEYTEGQENSDEIYIILSKQRNGERGKKKKLKYIRTLSKFMEVDYGN
jgi:replicative DNA helicase